MARKNKGLPFVVQPRLEPIIERVGTEDSGIIEIRRQGYLSVAEKTMVDQATQDLSDQGELISAVKEIARAENRSISDIFDALQDPEGNALLLEKYAVEIATASGAARSQEDKIRIIAATALIICRIDPSWTVEQSMELHPDMLQGLHRLYVDEDARSIEALSAGAEQKETASKK
jgi:hypothetical protein